MGSKFTYKEIELSPEPFVLKVSEVTESTHPLEKEDPDGNNADPCDEVNFPYIDGWRYWTIYFHANEITLYVNEITLRVIEFIKTMNDMLP